MSLACDIKDIKDALEGLDTEIITTLCEKIDSLEESNDILCQKVENLEKKLCGPCPVPLAEDMTDANVVVLEGDQTEQFSEASEMEITDAEGNVVGTAEVVSSTYNQEANTTTVQLANSTVQAAQLSSVKSVVKNFVPFAPRLAEKAETPVKEPTKEEIVNTRG